MLVWTWCEAPICCLVQTGREGSQDGVSIFTPPPLDGHIPCRHNPVLVDAWLTLAAELLSHSVPSVKFSNCQGLGAV